MATETQARVTNYHALPRSKALRGPFTPGTDEWNRRVNSGVTNQRQVFILLHGSRLQILLRRRAGKN